MSENNKTSIIRVALPIPLRRSFDYVVPSEQSQKVLPGMRVKVPFQSRKLIGIVVETSVNSQVPLKKLKKIIEVLDSAPILSEEIFKLALWTADYYHAPIGEVLAATLPATLRKEKKARDDSASPLLLYPPQTEKKQDEKLSLSSAQQNAIDTILAIQNASRFQVTLLDGVTGSGKTEVYLQVIEKMLPERQILVLVPEINLTPQTVQRFQTRFNVPVIALHSSLNDSERYAAWSAAQNGTAKIVIGTRSAVFTPFAQLGLIVIDEEHDPSFKQQERFRYHARDVAIMRARELDIPIILGSATPSLESVHNVQKGRYQRVCLPERAGIATLPTFHIIDIRKTPLTQGLSLPLLHAIEDQLQEGNQVLLFINRRGFAPVWLCRSCGTVVECNRCDVRMIYHRTESCLHCHHCDSKKTLPEVCEHCGAQDFTPVGLGTQRIESVLAKHFPTIPIVRIDKDSTRRKGALQKLFDQVHEGSAKILIGTQMLAKGHHFPDVTLVGIIDLDGGLLSADFRAMERTGQLLVQVAGRSGRAGKKGSVYIQTHHPDHPLLKKLIQNNYTTFTEHLLLERKQASLPPFCYHALFRAEAHNIKDAENFLHQLKISCSNTSAIQLYGPIPAMMLRRAGVFRMSLLVQANQRNQLHIFLNQALASADELASRHRVRWILDVDPVEAF